MVDQAALIEVANEFIHVEFTLEGLDAFYAIVRLAEYRTEFFNLLESNLCQSAYRLLKALVTFGKRLNVWPALLEEAEKVPQTRFNLTPRLRPAGRRMDRKCYRNVLLYAGRKALAVRGNVLPQLVH
jgi:hypothetical protein